MIGLSSWSFHKGRSRRTTTCDPRVAGSARSMLAAGCMVAAAVLPGTVLAQAVASAPSLGVLKRLSVEELMELEVTSVSRQPEKLLEAAAAIQVVTGEDIRRSGASSIPEALRLLSSLDVAQKNAREWVISTRGFSSDVGNKLLVLMDGRTLYTPLFSGVFWDRQDYLLADLDRIEVVSGPGGALWGANAVNGVINIMTKNARDTQGVHVEAGGGDGLQGFFGARVGGKIAPNVYARVYGKYADRDSERYANGRDAREDWRMRQGGFRIDAEPSAQNAFTLQGDVYRSDEGITTGGRARVIGGNLLGRWSRTFSPESDLDLQVYYDRTHLVMPVPAFAFAPAGTFQDDLDTYDIDFQHRFRAAARHHVVWGLGYRRTHDKVGNAPALAFFPAVLDQDLFSGFAQDEITLPPETLKLTLGTKLEHNDYTGLEVEPSVRLQWNPTPRQLWWAAVSRAVRTPSRIDREISQPAPSYLLVVLKGGAKFESESVLAYELGYRAQIGPRLVASLSTFYNVYHDVRSTSLSPPDRVFNLPFPFFFENNLAADTYGLEFNASWHVLDRWRLHAGYNLLKEDVRVKPGKTDFNRTLNETADAEQQVSLRSSVDLFKGVALDTGLRWVDRRRVNNVGVPASVPRYAELDVRVGWRPTEQIELSVVGRNLLHDRHPEFGVPRPNRVEIGRSIFGKVTWRY